jgi:hypothetical protein
MKNIVRKTKIETLTLEEKKKKKKKKRELIFDD